MEAIRSFNAISHGRVFWFFFFLRSCVWRVCCCCIVAFTRSEFEHLKLAVFLFINSFIVLRWMRIGWCGYFNATLQVPSKTFLYPQ